MLKLKTSHKFKKDLKKFKHNKIVQDKLEEIIKFLLNGRKLPEKNKDHYLIGNYVNQRECHISPDVLLIYKRDEKQLSLERIGSHSDLF